jgi:hypothetical protein
LSINKCKREELQNRLDLIVASYTCDSGHAKTALVSGDPKLRASALLALHKLGELGIGELRTALNDQDPGVRRRACELAASYPRVSLSRSLLDADPFVVEMALWASGEREESKNLELICRLATDHSESLVREAAIAALGAIGDERGLETILGAGSDRPNVRRRAVVAMAAFEGDRVTEALRVAVTDRDWQTRQLAEDLLEITEGSLD